MSDLESIEKSGRELSQASLGVLGLLIFDGDSRFKDENVFGFSAELLSVFSGPLLIVVAYLLIKFVMLFLEYHFRDRESSHRELIAGMSQRGQAASNLTNTPSAVNRVSADKSKALKWAAAFSRANRLVRLARVALILIGPIIISAITIFLGYEKFALFVSDLL